MQHMKKILFVTAIALSFFGYSDRVQAATLSVVPEGESIKANQEFALDIKLDTESASVNAVQATVRFPKDVLEVIRTDKTSSAFTFWLEEPAIDEAGIVRFTTGSTSGLSGKSLEVLRVVFRMKGSGSAEVSLVDSAVTAADGAGTNVLFQSRGLKITAAVTSLPGQEVPVEIPLVPKPAQITRTATTASKTSTAPVVTVPFYPDPTAWNNLSDHFLAQWPLPADVVGVAAIINRDAGFVPTVSEGVFDNKTFPALGDGVNYLHVRFKNSIGWGATAHYRIAIDTAPPVGFDIAVTEGNPSAVPNPTLIFKSADQLSGLFRYAIRVDNKDTIFTNDSTYTLDLLPPGTYRVRVAAEDNAGNSTETTIQLEILPIPSPILSSLNRDLFVGEGDLFASGSVAPDTKLMLTLTDSKGGVAAAETVTPDSRGAWSVNLDTPLKRGVYTFSLIVVDERGAQSFPVTESLRVRPRPLLTVAGVGISQGWFFSGVIIALVFSFAAGIFIARRQKKSRLMRVFVLERDATNLLRHLREDVAAMRTLKTEKAGGADAAALAERINMNLKKMEDYVIESMRKINK